MVKDGLYQKTAPGHNGDIKVSVSLSSGKITDIEVIEHQETALLSDNALNLIPQKILENQSTEVDAVTGATFTSQGITSAVRKALIEAGAKSTEFANHEKIVQKDHQIATDVIVFGTGLAGLDAAITAKENGADVVLIEKTGRLGGNSVVSGGFMYATGSKFNRDQDNDPDNLIPSLV